MLYFLYILLQCCQLFSAVIYFINSVMDPDPDRNGGSDRIIMTDPDTANPDRQ
jgi:hypothetical protein